MRTANNRHKNHRYVLSASLMTGTMLSAVTQWHTSQACDLRYTNRPLGDADMIGKKKGRNGEKASYILFLYY